MRALAEVSEKIRGTSKKSEKVALLADYFRSRSIEEGAISAVFLSGKAFPAFEETTLNVGGTMLWKLIAELAPGGAPAVAEAYKKFGDLGDAAEETLAGAAESELGVLDAEAAFRAIAKARGPAAKKKILADLFARATALETKYLVKVIGGELRIGLKESLVLEAIAKAFEAEAPAVQRAAMLLGDVGETLRL
ncbi:MAG TPA: hypothetical protein VK459_15080, partial [Polyangiaceae bacterium]|nr:hypothetical protein [Polyangiaceae bacterium]